MYSDEEEGADVQQSPVESTIEQSSDDEDNSNRDSSSSSSTSSEEEEENEASSKDDGNDGMDDAHDSSSEEDTESEPDDGSSSSVKRSPMILDNEDENHAPKITLPKFVQKKAKISLPSSGAPNSPPKQTMRIKLKLPKAMQKNDINTSVTKRPRLPLKVGESERQDDSSKIPSESEATGTAVPLLSDVEATEVKAMVVDSDEQPDVVATALSLPPSVVQSKRVATTKKSTTNKSLTLKRRLPLVKNQQKTETASNESEHPQQQQTNKRRSSKIVKFPPIGSPGLLCFQAGGSLTTPAHLFNIVMESQGYTKSNRREHPHRGSSVQRTVDDLFDTNVRLALHPVQLVQPPELLHSKLESNEDDIRGMTLPECLIRAFEGSATQKMKGDHENSDNTVRIPPAPKPPIAFRDMVPVSLTIPYPEDFIQKRLEYLDAVEKRERAIVEYQLAEEELEIAKEEHQEFLIKQKEEEDLLSKTAEGKYTTEQLSVNHEQEGTETGSSKPSLMTNNPILIPPIPEPPDPPKLRDLLRSKDFDKEIDPSSLSPSPYYYLDGVGSESSKHPIYLPKAKEGLVSHLDPHCFHISEGRYFGLISNVIADPNFIGSNAPGIAGITSAGGGSGLATATTSTTTNISGLSGGGMTMILSSSFHCAAAVPPSSLKQADGTKEGGTTNEKVSLVAGSINSVTLEENKPDSIDVDANSQAGRKKKTPIVQAAIGSSGRATPGNTTSDLSNNNVSAEVESASTTKTQNLRDWIIRAAVYASRTGHHGRSFTAPNGKTFSEIGKMFASLSGIKPCERCKNNKQGVSDAMDDLLSILFVCVLFFSHTIAKTWFSPQGISLSITKKAR
jgi:hypothetical protein